MILGKAAYAMEQFAPDSQILRYMFSFRNEMATMVDNLISGEY